MKYSTPAPPVQAAEAGLLIGGHGSSPRHLLRASPCFCVRVSVGRSASAPQGQTPVCGRGLVCKHLFSLAKIRSLVCEPSFAHRASGSPASAQPAWERICAAGRGETAALKMPPPRPESGTKTPEVFSGVKRPEGEHWRRERSRRAADASAGALILKDKLTTTIFTCRRRNGGVRGGTRRGVPLRTARPSAVPRGIQRRGVLRYCRST